MRLTPEQRLQIVELYYENHGSVRATYRALRQFYGAHNLPSERLIMETMNRFTTTFSLNDNIHPVRPETIAVVQESVEEDANVSVPRRAQQFHLCHSNFYIFLFLYFTYSNIKCQRLLFLNLSNIWALKINICNFFI